jgi:NADP-dependent 3-hydroxy acid dehydrogenase YdfG
MSNFKGTVAVVTGSAGGIGLACAVEFAKLGCHLLLADISAGNLATAADRVRALGTRVETIVCDVTSDNDTEKLLEAANKMGRVSILHLNAGIAAGGRLELIPLDEWRRLLDVNVFGVVRGLQAFVPSMVSAQAPAHIIITG